MHKGNDMYVAFFKAKHGNWFHKLIALWTGGPYSHAELYFENTKEAFSARNESDECSFIPFNIMDDRFDIIKVPRMYSCHEAYQYCKDVDGAEYDWSGIIFNFIIPVNAHSRRRYFCSEVIVNALLAAGLNLGVKAHKTDPNRLYKELLDFKCRITFSKIS